MASERYSISIKVTSMRALTKSLHLSLGRVEVFLLYPDRDSSFQDRVAGGPRLSRRCLNCRLLDDPG